MRKNGIVNKYEYVKEKITMDNKEKALLCHKEWNGKLETVAKSKVKTREDLAIAYTPGVAEPCKVIAEDKTAAYTYTWKANTVAVVSDGSAVLGLGNIGPYAAMPVMEGKCVLFKEFGNVNAVPIRKTAGGNGTIPFLYRKPADIPAKPPTASFHRFPPLTSSSLPVFL